MAAFDTQSGAGINSPTFIGGSGFPNADRIVGNTSGVFWHLSNGFTGTWTQTLNGFQGGPATAPVFLLGGSPVAGVSGTIGGQGSQEYYGFFWTGGAFSTTAAITGASPAASYLFTERPASSFCSGGPSQSPDSIDSFTSTISISNLAPGKYGIGIDANDPNDPDYSLTFNTPVTVTASRRSCAHQKALRAGALEEFLGLASSPARLSSRTDFRTMGQFPARTLPWV
jgi:hypothetical protein